ncbi:MAG: GAF domain-containing protein [Elusimicrobia bacterium]|nr:GAF domain-containing protein [Elusimicrobiota bacterium]
MLTPFHTTALLEALSDLHNIHEETALYTFVLNRACDVLKAQGGTFFSVRENVGELYPEATKGVSLALLREIPFKMKLGIAGWSATHRSTACVDNAPGDERFNRAVDVITGVRTRSVLCVPVVRKDVVLGVIELVNRVDGIFHESDIDFLQYLAKQVGVAVENCRLYRSTQETLAYTSSVLNSLSGGFISTDLKGNVTRCNNAACRILGIVAEDVLEKPLLKALPQYPAFAAILDVTQRHQSSASRQEISLQRQDGSTMLLGYTTFVIRSEMQNHGAGILFQDLTHLRRNS